MRASLVLGGGGVWCRSLWGSRYGWCRSGRSRLGAVAIACAAFFAALAVFVVTVDAKARAPRPLPPMRRDKDGKRGPKGGVRNGDGTKPAAPAAAPDATTTAEASAPDATATQN